MADKEGYSGAEHHKQKTENLKELAKQEKIFLQTQKLKTAGKTKQKNANIKNNESIAKDGIMPELNTVTLPNSFSFFFNDKFE